MCGRESWNFHGVAALSRSEIGKKQDNAAEEEVFLFPLGPSPNAFHGFARSRERRRGNSSKKKKGVVSPSP